MAAEIEAGNILVTSTNSTTDIISLIALPGEQWAEYRSTGKHEFNLEFTNIQQASAFQREVEEREFKRSMMQIGGDVDA